MEGRVPGEFNFIFCDDEYLMQLNYKYLKHRTLTDIITFPVEDENSTLCGDIFISIPRVKENAGKFNQTTADELHRVMIHGILHLAGYHDKSKQEKEEMRRKENHYLEARLFT
jgi:rRNA maturation RNase YbeY